MVKIRKGKKSDLDDYLKHQLEAFPSENKKRHREYFQKKVGNNEILVLELKGNYIGHLTFSIKNSPPFINSYYLEELVVAKNQRNKGYGTKLVKDIIEKAKNNDFVTRILLDTEDSKKNKAIRFYKRLGFKKVGHLYSKYGKEAFYELEL